MTTLSAVTDLTPQNVAAAHRRLPEPDENALAGLEFNAVLPPPRRLAGRGVRIS